MFEHYLWNPKTKDLYMYGFDEGLELSSTGALLAFSGEKTGRSPKDKRVVSDGTTENIWWGPVNMRLNSELFEFYKKESSKVMEKTKRIYRIDAYAGWDPKHRIKVTIYCTCAYHALFMKNMLIPSDEIFDKPDFTIYNFGDQNLKNHTKKLEDGMVDKSLDDTLVALNLTSMEMIIIGTRYAGEMKKGVLTLMMYLGPKSNHLTLHSSANINTEDDNLCFFFGLSGTGKTTLSADSDKALIGDDEHVWTDTGVYNIEGGCYAKCIGLKKEHEPEIFNAIRYGAVMENVVYNKDGVVDYEDVSITQNTRCSYPLYHIDNALIPAFVHKHPKNIVFLSCDAFGVLPPVAKLTPEQAVYFFVSGYTSKVAGTEIGVTEPQATFSACFGEPFLVWNPLQYGNLLKDKMEKHGVNVWMLNTGWIEGRYGVGHRISLKYTRAIVDAIHNGSLLDVEYDILPTFNLLIPKTCEGVDSKVLNPSNTWSNRDEYFKKLEHLKNLFDENWAKY